MSAEVDAVYAMQKAISDVLWDTPELIVVGHDVRERQFHRILAVNRIAAAALAAAPPALPTQAQQMEYDR